MSAVKAPYPNNGVGEQNQDRVGKLLGRKVLTLRGEGPLLIARTGGPLKILIAARTQGTAGRVACTRPA